MGSPSSHSSSGQIATCTEQEVKGADSPSGEIVSQAAGMANPSTRRWEMRCVSETFPEHTVYHPLDFPCIFFAVGRCPWTWRFGTHRMGTMQYYFKGSAFADPTSPILSAPRVSSLMSNPALGLVWYIPVASVPLNELCKNFSLFHCLCWGSFGNLFL